MIININKKWRITSDSNGWIIEQCLGMRVKPMTGEEVPRWKGVAYLQSLEKAIAHLFEIRVRMIDSDSPREIVEQIQQFRQEARKALAPFNQAGQGLPQ